MHATVNAPNADEKYHAYRNVHGEKNAATSVYSPLTGIHDRDSGVAFCLDVSELLIVREKMVEQEKLAAMGTLAAGLAHEVGNPLSSILAIRQLIERKGAARSNRSIPENEPEPVLGWPAPTASSSALEVASSFPTSANKVPARRSRCCCPKPLAASYVNQFKMLAKLIKRVMRG